MCLPRQLLNHLITAPKQLEVFRCDRVDETPLPETFVAVERSEAENDPSYKQIIPYCLVMCGYEMLCYCRNGEEHRLKGKYSFGIGGHVHENENPKDALIREVQEEVGVEYDSVSGPYIIGYINDDTTEVGKVHFGVIYVVTVQYKCDLRFSDEIRDPHWIHINEITKRAISLESWSQLIVDNFHKFNVLTMGW